MMHIKQEKEIKMADRKLSILLGFLPILIFSALVIVFNVTKSDAHTKLEEEYLKEEIVKEILYAIQVDELGRVSGFNQIPDKIISNIRLSDLVDIETLREGFDAKGDLVVATFVFKGSTSVVECYYPGGDEVCVRSEAEE